MNHRKFMETDFGWLRGYVFIFQSYLNVFLGEWDPSDGFAQASVVEAVGVRELRIPYPRHCAARLQLLLRKVTERSKEVIVAGSALSSTRSRNA